MPYTVIVQSLGGVLGVVFECFTKYKYMNLTT